jgi:hypothetical protein
VEELILPVVEGRVSGVINVRQFEIYPSELLVSEPNPREFEMAIENFK